MFKGEVIGNLGKDPEIKFAQDGTPSCRFSVAASHRGKRDGADKPPTWVNVTMFGKMSELCGTSLKKGQRVYLSGDLELRSYEDDKGKGQSLDMIARDFEFLTPKDDAGADDARRERADAAPF